jgi:putative metallohydrolase (TIGR04338 family)
MTRDSQKGKVYAAEQLVRRILDRTGESPVYEIHGSTLVLEQERRFGSLRAVVDYVAAVQAMPWYRERYPDAGPLAVRQRKGNMVAHYDRQSQTIAVHDTEQAGRAWAMREIVVLHEMAHHVGESAHGGRFCAEFIEHVRQVIGENVALLLRICLQEDGCLITA